MIEDFKPGRFASAVTAVIVLVSFVVIYLYGVTPVPTFASISPDGKIGPPPVNFSTSGWYRVTWNFVLLVLPAAVGLNGVFRFFSRKLERDSKPNLIGIILRVFALFGLGLWTFIIMSLSASPWPFGL